MTIHNPSVDLAAQVARIANLDPGRWAVKVEYVVVNDTVDGHDETRAQAIASVRVFSVTPNAELRGSDYTSVVQTLAARLGRELRAVIAAHDVDAETMRRLHEEATKRSADLRIALEALVTASAHLHDNVWLDEPSDEALGAAIDAAREVLA